MALIRLNRAKLRRFPFVLALSISLAYSTTSIGQTNSNPVQPPVYQFSNEAAFVGQAGAPGQLVELGGQACQNCSQPAGACQCRQGIHGGQALGGTGGCGHAGCGSGGCGVGACYGTNLYWCSPYPVPYEGPCDLPLCDECLASSMPLWYVSAEFVALNRDQHDEFTYQTLTDAGIPVVGTGDFKTEFDAGMRITGGATLTELYRAEVSYLGAFEWDDRVAVRNMDPNTEGTLGDLFSPFSNFGDPTGIVGLDYNNFASIETRSKFNSLEFNVRRRYIPRDQLWPAPSRYCVANSFLLGLRYLQVNEEFAYLTGSAAPAGIGAVNDILARTNNDMFGVQIGMLSQFQLREYGWIDFEIKGGIYNNDASLRSDYTNSDTAGNVLISYSDRDSRSRTAFLGEISLNYNHQFTSRLSCRVGYNAFWLTGVVLASQNVNPNPDILALGPAMIDHSGDVVYHGPNIGFVYAW